jgi:iron complex transport system substrate-binding protein
MNGISCGVLVIALCVSMAFMPANALDFTLQIFGNANMDDTIDELDIEYVQGIIDGSKDKTKLSDANYDGTIDEMDIKQIQMIIDGTDEFLILPDDTGNSIRIPMPVTSYVYHGHNNFVYETLRAIDASDKIIGITDRYVTPGGMRYSETYFPELLSGVESIGDLQAINYEVINNLKPDVVFTDAGEYYDPTKTPDIPVVAMDVNIKNSKEACMVYGYILDKVSEAKDYVDWMNALEDEILDRTKTIPESKKPLVYLGSYSLDTTSFSVPAKDNYQSVMVRSAGGKCIGDEIEGSGSLSVDAEWIISRNPDVIIFTAGSAILQDGERMGYDMANAQNVTKAIDEFMNRPEFANVNAIKNKKIFMVSHNYINCGGASGLIGTLYYAKWLHPDYFADMDAQAIHQEFVTRFQHLDLDITKSVCVYPPPQNE